MSIQIDPVSKPPAPESPLKLTTSAGTDLVNGIIEIGDSAREISFRSTHSPLANPTDSFLAAALLPAMRMGRRLEIEGPVSPRLIASIETIQDIIHCWFPQFSRIPIRATPRIHTRPPGGGRGVACFFSGGVDSFYTVLKHLPEIDALILVRGFDIALDDEALWGKTSSALRIAASELGTPLVEFSTNVRTLLDPHCDWGRHSHGPALASIALLMGQSFHKVYIPATSTYRELFPWGSHPLVDGLWSTEDVELVHDGCEATRLEKVQAIATNPVAMKTLRVCWKNLDGAYNCGRCEKCIRTMVELRIAGSLGQCQTFDRSLSMKAVSNTRMNTSVARHYQDALATIQSRGRDPELASALSRCLMRGRLRRLPSRAMQTIKTLAGR